MTSDTQDLLLQNRLRDLAKFRAETVALFDSLVAQAEKARKKATEAEKKTLKTADNLGFALECMFGLRALAKIAASGVKLTGEALKKSNALFADKLKKETQNKVVGVADAAFDPDGLIEMAVNTLNFSPTYWLNRVTLWGTHYFKGDPNQILKTMITQLEKDRTAALTRIDDDIKRTSYLRKFSTAGVDLGSLA